MRRRPTPDLAQPNRTSADTARMNTDPVACALWLGSLLAVTDTTLAPLPAALNDFVVTYLALIRPVAQA